MTSLNQQWDNGQFGEWDPLTPAFYETHADLDMRALAGRPDLRVQRKRAALRMTTLIPAARRSVPVWTFASAPVVAGLVAVWAVWIR